MKKSLERVCFVNKYKKEGKKVRRKYENRKPDKIDVYIMYVNKIE